MSYSDLEYDAWCSRERLKQAKLDQEYLDDLERDYELRKLEKDLQHKRDLELIQKADKSIRVQAALEELRVLRARELELERLINESTS